MKKVVYIEDNPANQRLVTQVFKRLPKLELLNADEPISGLELIEKHQPDLILLDINLPGMDGFEVFKRLREKQGCENTPVIAISANAMQEDIDKALALGFDDYIVKPVNISALLQVLENTLQ
ncbi:MAG: response regulator [Gammaproteobacteria bacterium]|nr:response regulator [Gammaproteobacteria bacterium]